MSCAKRHSVWIRVSLACVQFRAMLAISSSSFITVTFKADLIYIDIDNPIKPLHYRNLLEVTFYIQVIANSYLLRKSYNSGLKFEHPSHL